MARVIAGEAGGRRLAVPDGRDTRPTSDRAREGLFATIVSIDGLAGRGARARPVRGLRRGRPGGPVPRRRARAAGRIGRPGRRVIRENIEAIGLPGAEVVTDRVERVLARGPARPGEGRGRYDIVFADPPYALPADEVSGMLTLLLRGWLAPEALVIVERATRSGPVSWPDGLRAGPGAPVRGGDLLVRSRPERPRPA